MITLLLQAHPFVQLHTYPAVQEVFGPELLRYTDSRTWIYVMPVLMYAMTGAGPGHVAPPAEKAASVAALRALFRPACLADEARAHRFVNTVLHKLNDVLTEFNSALRRIDDAARDASLAAMDAAHAQQLYQPCVYMFHLTVGLLTALQLVATTAPELLLRGRSPAAELNLARSVEVLLLIFNRSVPWTEPGTEASESATLTRVLSLGVPALQTITRDAIVCAVVGTLLALDAAAASDASSSDGGGDVVVEAVLSDTGYRRAPFDALLASPSYSFASSACASAAAVGDRCAAAA